MTKKEIIAELVKKYHKADYNWEHAGWEGKEKYHEGQVDILEEILEDIFGFKDFWCTEEGILMGGQKEVK